MDSTEQLEAKFRKMLKVASKREADDDHFDDNERQVFVDLYKQLHPEEVLPADVNEAFCQVLFENE